MAKKLELSQCQYAVVYDHEYTTYSGWENDPGYNSVSARSRVPTIEGFKTKADLVVWIEANETAHKFGYGHKAKSFQAFEIRPHVVQ